MTDKIEPHILRKFEIIQKIGKGAYGIVWKAIDKKYIFFILYSSKYLIF